MADTISRPSATSRRAAGEKLSDDVGRTQDPRSRPTALVGLALALWTAVLGLAVLVCLTLTAWVTATHHDDAIRPAIATAVQAWLLAQHTSIAVGAGSVSIVPLGLTFLLGALLVHTGRLAVRLSGARDRLDAVTAAVAVALPYAVIAALLTKPAQLGQVRPSPLQALLGSFLLALLGAGLGALRETDQLQALTARIPADLRTVLRAGFAASAVLVGVGAAAVVVGLAASASRAGSLASSLHGGYSGTALMAVISLGYTPNVVGWAAAYSLGPGFAVGSHTSVSLVSAHLGAVPAFPLLAPLPASGRAPVFAWLVILGPVMAGIAAGWLIARTRSGHVPSGEESWWQRHRLPASAWGFAAGMVAGATVGAFAWLSAGSLGGGRMSTLGPPAEWVFLAAAGEVGVIAAATVWAIGWKALRDRAA